MEAVKTLNDDFYMDDCLKSVQNVNEAIKMVKELKNLCKKGGFNLTKWCSNHKEVLSEIPTEDLSKELRNQIWILLSYHLKVHSEFCGTLKMTSFNSSAS